jgi:hypothetical protein
MLIFLAGVALLVMLVLLGERAGAHLFHGGTHRYFDHCATCSVDYPRPAGLQRLVCPHGHVMSAVVAAPHTPRPHGDATIAVCAGFIVVTVVLTVTGVVPPP